jgi:hypothetical protein
MKPLLSKRRLVWRAIIVLPLIGTYFGYKFLTACPHVDRPTWAAIIPASQSSPALPIPADRCNSK